MENNELQNQVIAASLLKRLLAGIIDFVIIFLLSYLGKSISIVKLPGLENTCCLYYFLCFMHNQTTMGGRILNIHTIKNNGSNLSKVRSCLKATFVFLFLLMGIIIWSLNFVSEDSMVLIEPTIAVILGIILLISPPMILSKNKRSLIDILSGTRVVFAATKNLNANNIAKG